MLTDQELQSLRNMGNEAEAAAEEIDRLRAALRPFADVFDGDLSGIGGGTSLSPVLCVQMFKDAKAALTPKDLLEGLLEQSRWRPEVIAFADAMESRLRENDHKGGWQDSAPHWLMMRLIGEASELLDELDPGSRAASQFYAASRMLAAACEELNQFGPHLRTNGNTGRVLAEAADVANFAMMIADRINRSNALAQGRPE